MLTEDKVSHLSHVILTAIKTVPGVRLKRSDELVLKEIKKVLADELAQEQRIDRTVRAKLASYSRGLVEGSAEWDVLYRKTFEEETRKQVKI
ncbi:MAG: DUF507 family protein [Nitrospira sp.]|nr:DUF507 family protein [Nitrospira sp.]MBS0156659.1 DUF507 family protein [Nitrospira sp.]MBS0165300.1 DUF507 family protein [Nitrospira sp.]MBX3328530.1 DUF507 family protein [Nitrospira sp.]